MIEVRNLSKKYGSHVAVKDVSFTVQDGEVIGLLGLNGAGKSTIMNIMTGYLSMTAGTVNIGGFDILQNPAEAKRHIGYLPELPPLYPDMTVKEYLGFMYDLKKVKLPKTPHIEEICRLIKLQNVYNRLIKNLSKGYRQRVGIAQALLGNPDVIILDEPTVGLDPKQIIEIRTLIHNLGRNHTVIVSSHILSEIQSVCDRIIVINNGKIIADGKPQELGSMITGDNAIKLRIILPEGKDSADIKKLLENLEGTDKVLELGEIEAGSLDFEVSSLEGLDIRGKIVNELVAVGASVLSLKTAEFNLEEVFLSLTDKDGKAEEEE